MPVIEKDFSKHCSFLIGGYLPFSDKSASGMAQDFVLSIKFDGHFDTNTIPSSIWGIYSGAVDKYLRLSNCH